ncbi:unnamed protein product [Bursaphelenchus xylophilus]|uniref:(pine wood nematode) hypothetical protein n=1 Tax=Bursaphelenchus xylophilus TaxID=6326 RepID=A0A1I7RW73_BURXY|nr:unnamed protein product [Bursaphelenchus xylophilus]CAG9095220.1 unnamed protein product [Bursaphelenchus xylophilus]
MEPDVEKGIRPEKKFESRLPAVKEFGYALPLPQKLPVIQKKFDDDPADYCMCMSHVHTGTQLIGMITLLWCLASSVRSFAATSQLLTCFEGVFGMVATIILLTGNRRNLWLYYIPFLLFFTVDVCSWLTYAFYLMFYDFIDETDRLPLKADLVVMFKSVGNIEDVHRLVFGVLLIFKSTIYIYMIYVVARGMLFLKRGGRLPMNTN